MRSNMPPQKDFSKVPQIKSSQQRSVFDRSHTHKTTFQAGYLIPFLLDEILPGDTVKLAVTFFSRIFAPLIYPVMDNLHMDFHYFFVPNRLLWENWENFQGASEDPEWDRDYSSDYTIPTVTSVATGFARDTVYDYMGYPTETLAAKTASNLPARAYRLIYNEWYRDQNLQDSEFFEKDDGPDLWGNYKDLLKRGKRHDYFTSCLPEPQKGTAVGISLTGEADVWGDGKTLGLYDGNLTERVGLFQDSGSGSAEFSETVYNQNVGTAVGVQDPTTNNVGLGVVEQGDGVSGLVADLTSASAILINDLRESLAIQQMLELDARGGTRYVEILKSRFGVTSPDYRLQRPEYLGGGSFPMNVNVVQQTSRSDSGEDSLGTLAAHASAGGSHNGFSKSFVEHGYVLGIVSVRADLTYQEGLPRMLSRSTRYDFYEPVFANLGEQEVLSQEIYCDGQSADSNVFGYQERWAEYRYFPSKITGYFRSNVGEGLDSYHLSQEFNPSRPTLSTSFIEETPPMNRIMRTGIIENQPDILFDSFISLKHARPLPVYSVPGLRRF